VPAKKELGPRQVRGVDAKEAAEAFDEGPAAEVAGRVAEVGAGDGTEGADHCHQPDVEVARRGIGRHRQEHGFAREGDTRRLDEDAEAGGWIPDGVGQGADIG